MHRKWSVMIKSQKQLQQKLKNSKGVYEYFSDIPEKGYMKDNITKNQIKLTDCTSPRLRRYVKLLKKYYSLCTQPDQRKAINDKLIEVQEELSTRPDAEIKHEENE